MLSQGLRPCGLTGKSRRSQTGWSQQGSDIAVTYADGDRFRVSLDADGTLRIYRNGELLVTRTLSAAVQPDTSMIPAAPAAAYDAPSVVEVKPISYPVPGSIPNSILNLPQLQSGPVTINYVYDPLYRLTEANYSTGDSYQYTYDAVGNRLTETTQLATTNYAYDIANRLTSVNGANYTSDNNGNLLNDGVNSYSYNAANQLTAMSGPFGPRTFAYNGLGDRLTQNGVNYTLDLNAGLTQVLNDGTNTYLYGNGRIAQTDGTTEYFLGDSLGSVRQLTDSQGEITLVKSYAPYGEVIGSTGNGVSPFAFTGEQLDTSGLTYLRARYYSSGDGRFISRDRWMGDYENPLSLNRWMYVEGNPINFTDPSGHITEKESKRADVILENLYDNYSVYIEKDWGYRPIPYFSLLPESTQLNYVGGCYWEQGNWRSLDELELTLQAVKDMARTIGGAGRFRTAMKWRPVKVYRLSSDLVLGKAGLTTIGERVLLPNQVFDSDDLWAKGTIVHEFSHVWDYRRWHGLSRFMNAETQSFDWVCLPTSSGRVCHWEYDPTGQAGPTIYARAVNPEEDWAESFTRFVYSEYKKGQGALGPIRKDYIERVLRDFPFFP